MSKFNTTIGAFALVAAVALMGAQASAQDAPLDRVLSNVTTEDGGFAYGVNADGSLDTDTVWYQPLTKDYSVMTLPQGTSYRSMFLQAELLGDDAGTYALLDFDSANADDIEVRAQTVSSPIGETITTSLLFATRGDVPMVGTSEFILTDEEVRSLCYENCDFVSTLRLWDNVVRVSTIPGMDCPIYEITNGVNVQNKPFPFQQQVQAPSAGFAEDGTTELFTACGVTTFTRFANGA